MRSDIYITSHTDYFSTQAIKHLIAIHINNTEKFTSFVIRKILIEKERTFNKYNNKNCQHILEVILIKNKIPTKQNSI